MVKGVSTTGDPSRLPVLAWHKIRMIERRNLRELRGAITAKILIMKNIKKPSFIFGLGSHIVFVIALFLMANDYPYATWVMYGGLAMGAIYWILTIIEVANAGPEELKKYQKSFWLILVVAIPMFGALLYHIMHQRRRKIAA